MTEREVHLKLSEIKIDNNNLDYIKMTGEICGKLRDDLVKLFATPTVSKRLFLCDSCGQEKDGKKFPVFDENWNKQNGLNQCEDCFKEGCRVD